MLDSRRAMALYMIGFVPIALGFFLYIILGTPPSIECAMITIVLSLAGVVYVIIFRFHPRVQHYIEAVNEFDRNYRYEEKKIERLDLSDTKMRDVDPAVCDYIIRALEPMIQHLQSLVDQFTRMPIVEIPEEAQ